MINTRKILSCFASGVTDLCREGFLLLLVGAQSSAAFTEAVGAGALPCHEVNMWSSHRSDDVFSGWRSISG